MESRNLGRTPLRVSCIALGGNVFGHFCGPRETETILAMARDLGVNLVDTSDSYSDGRSEEVIGDGLGGARASWVIATKVGVHTGESAAGIGRKETIFERVDGSLRRLRTDYIDLYQMHHFDPITPLEETLGALSDLVAIGKIRYGGASNYTVAQLDRACDISRRLGIPPLAGTQNHYNLLKQQARSEVFPVCREMGIGVLVYGALARGVLGGKYTLGSSAPAGSRASVSVSVQDDLTEPVLRTVSNLSKFADARGQSVGNLALAWVLASPEVSSAIVGVRDSRQLQQNVAAADWRLSDAELSEIDMLVGNLDSFDSVSLGSHAAHNPS